MPSSTASSRSSRILANGWPSIAKPSGCCHTSFRRAAADGRRDTDADWGKQTFPGAAAQGQAGKKVIGWFGYKIHLLVDATDQLPVA